ncbi:MAG: alpha/beta hydrolase [Actinomycetaceae bacterium]|nr:alpha/beta hydrolase [Actinomycetaceae bacterium]
MTYNEKMAHSENLIRTTPSEASNPILAFRRTGAHSSLPIVLLHAMPLDGSMWDTMRDLLPEIDIISVDAPGFGASPSGEVFAQAYGQGAGDASLEIYARAVAATLDKLEIERAVFVGISIGGAVAAAFADLFPQRVAGLVIMDSNVNADSKQVRENRQKAIELCEQGKAYQTIKDWSRTMLSPQSLKLLSKKLDGIFREVSSPALAWLQRAQLARPDRRVVIASLDVPLLFIRGKDDVTCSREMLSELRDLAGAGRVVEVRGAGHFSALEKPEPCAQLLRSFYREVSN